MGLRAIVTSLSLLGVVGSACGYSGLASLDAEDPTASPEAGGGMDAAAVDALVPDVATPPPPSGCGTPTCSLPTAPAGWVLALFESGRVDACPAGFDAADAIENPVAATDACTCGTCATTGTSCSMGAIPTAYDMGGGACGSTGANASTNAGNCTNMIGQFGVDARIDPPTAMVGTCTAAEAPDRAHVAADSRRVCARQTSTCDDLACSAPASMTACIAAPGDVPCPAGGPSTKHLLGSDFTLSCAACGCSITSATCGGELDFYPVDNCAGTPVKLTVGTCTNTNQADFHSTKWKPMVSKETCATTPGAPTTTLAGLQTICCP